VSEALQLLALAALLAVSLPVRRLRRILGRLARLGLAVSLPAAVLLCGLLHLHTEGILDLLPEPFDPWARQLTRLSPGLAPWTWVLAGGLVVALGVPLQALARFASQLDEHVTTLKSLDRRARAGLAPATPAAAAAARTAVPPATPPAAAVPPVAPVSPRGTLADLIFNTPSTENTGS